MHVIHVMPPHESPETIVYDLLIHSLCPLFYLLVRLRALLSYYVCPLFSWQRKLAINLIVNFVLFFFINCIIK